MCWVYGGANNKNHQALWRNTTSTDRPFEYLRLTSLGVIGALVKVDDQNLGRERSPRFFFLVETGYDASKVQRDKGFVYILCVKKCTSLVNKS